QRGLARAVFADDEDGLAARDAKVERPERESCIRAASGALSGAAPGVAPGEGIPHAAKLELAPVRRVGLAARGQRDRAIEARGDRGNAAERGLRLAQLRQDHDDLLDRTLGE